MRFLPAILAALLCAPSFADDMVFRNDKDILRLTQAACPAAISERLPEQYRKNFMQASAIVEGKSFNACWMVLNDGRVFVQYDDGDTGVLYITNFLPEEGV